MVQWCYFTHLGTMFTSCHVPLLDPAPLTQPQFAGDPGHLVGDWHQNLGHPVIIAGVLGDHLHLGHLLLAVIRLMIHTLLIFAHEDTLNFSVRPRARVLIDHHTFVLELFSKLLIFIIAATELVVYIVG